MTPRAAVTIVFALNGILFGAWAARLAAVGDRLTLSPGELGFALAFVAAGALVAMPISGRAANRFGSRPTTRVALALFCLAAVLAPAAPSLALFCMACALWGAAGGALDVAMNAHGVAVEAKTGRPILSSFHAAFSAGGLAGALLGAAGAAVGIDVRVQMAAMAVAALAVGVVATRALLPASADAVGKRPPARERGVRRVDARLLVLGALAFFCLMSEGAVADWSAIYVDRSLAASAAVAGLAFAAFSVAMVAGRLVGDRLTERLGSTALVRGGALVSAAGMTVALIASTPAAAAAGFACMGAGLSVVVPNVFRAAAATGDSGPALAVVSTIGYTGFLAGPPLIGAIAELTSLPTALGLLPLIALVMAVLAPVTRAGEPAQPPRQGGKPPALLSDLDGVLVDSTASVERAWREFASANGIPYDELAPRIHGVPSRQTIADVAPHLDAAAESRRLDAAQADDVDGVVALPGARTLVGTGYGGPVAIVTSCDARLATARLTAAGIEPPPVVVTSDQVDRGKPHPDAYLLAAERLGRAPHECVVIEDAPAGVAAGKAAGMRVVALLTTHAEADLHEADHVVADLRGLPAVLNGRLTPG